jgi:hypothetical protein
MSATSVEVRHVAATAESTAAWIALGDGDDDPGCNCSSSAACGHHAT